MATARISSCGVTSLSTTRAPNQAPPNGKGKVDDKRRTQLTTTTTEGHRAMPDDADREAPMVQTRDTKGPGTRTPQRTNSTMRMGSKNHIKILTMETDHQEGPLT